LAVSWLVGYVLALLITSRLPRWLPARQRAFLDPAAHIARRRLPWWALLVGVWLAAGYWPLTPEAELLIGRSIFVVGAASITLATATAASQSVHTYGSLIAPVLPVSSLTRNVAWTLITTLGLLVILNGLGLSITPMLTALGVGGLAVGSVSDPYARRAGHRPGRGGDTVGGNAMRRAG